MPSTDLLSTLGRKVQLHCWSSIVHLQARADIRGFCERQLQRTRFDLAPVGSVGMRCRAGVIISSRCFQSVADDNNVVIVVT